MALGESVARAGIKKLVMVTSHGGNSAAMSWWRRICARNTACSR
jgi:creatinine amidohydrolase/Fe(II)-dependent formamide hydrolase-like protein